MSSVIQAPAAPVPLVQHMESSPGDAGDPARGGGVREVLLGPAVPAAVAAAATGGFAALGLLHYLTYHSQAYDLGFFDQVVERTAQGHPFQTAFLGYSFLGEHWEPVLLAWVPLDRIAPTPIWLLLVTAVALGAAPIAAWRLARAWLGRSWAAPVAALACALDPLVGRAAAYDYHSEVLVPVLALTSLDGAARGRRWQFLLPAVALGLVKEDALLVAAGVGWIAFCVHRRVDALLLLAGAVAAFVAVVGAVMPDLRDGVPGDLADRYAYLGGDTVGSMLRGAVTHPGRVLEKLAGGDARQGWAVALYPLAALPLLAGWSVLAVLPILVVALLSSLDQQSQLTLQYGVEAFPLLLACALLGWRRLRDLRPDADAAAGALVAATLVAGYVVSSPLPGSLHLDGAQYTGLDRRGAVEDLLARVPPDASVSATSGLVPHLSARADVYEFPDRRYEEEYVVIDSATFEEVWSGRWVPDAVAGLSDHGYHLVASAAGVDLWQR